MATRRPDIIELDQPWVCPRCGKTYHTARVVGTVPVPVARGFTAGLILDCPSCPPREEAPGGNP